MKDRMLRESENFAAKIKSMESETERRIDEVSVVSTELQQQEASNPQRNSADSDSD